MGALRVPLQIHLLAHRRTQVAGQAGSRKTQVFGPDALTEGVIASLTLVLGQCQGLRLLRCHGPALRSR
jgi:hypothetical protein